MHGPSVLAAPTWWILYSDMLEFCRGGGRKKVIGSPGQFGEDRPPAGTRLHRLAENNPTGRHKRAVCALCAVVRGTNKPVDILHAPVPP